MKRTDEYYKEVIDKIEDGNTYKSFRYLCDDIGIDYDLHKSGESKTRIMSLIKKQYKVVKDGWEITLNKLNNHEVIERDAKDNAENLLTDKFNMASKLFQAKMVEYLADRAVEDDNLYSINENMYSLLTKFGMITENHYKLNPNKNNIIQDLDDNVIDVYYDKYYSDVVRLYERGLDNLQKRKGLTYKKGHNVNYKVIEETKKLKEEYQDFTEEIIDSIIEKSGDKVEKYYYNTTIIKNEVNHKFSLSNEDGAIYNGRYDAWEKLKQVLNLNEAKTPEDINFFTLFSDKTDNYYKNNEDIRFDIYKRADDILNTEEYKLLQRYFNNYNFKLYDLFRSIVKIETAKHLEKILGYTDTNLSVKVDNYYTAYQILFRRSAYILHHDRIVKDILLEGNPKDENRSYIIDRMFKTMERLNVLQCNEDLLEDIVGICSYTIDKKRASNSSKIMKYYKDKYLNNNH